MASCRVPGNPCGRMSLYPPSVLPPGAPAPLSLLGHKDSARRLGRNDTCFAQHRISAVRELTCPHRRPAGLVKTLVAMGGSGRRLESPLMGGLPIPWALGADAAAAAAAGTLRPGPACQLPRQLLLCSLPPTDAFCMSISMPVETIHEIQRQFMKFKDKIARKDTADFRPVRLRGNTREASRVHGR